MRAPTYETSAGALAALLNSGAPLSIADLYTITLYGGQVLRYTAADIALTVNSKSFGLGPAITRGRTTLSIGVNVDSLDVTFFADATVTVNGTPLITYIARNGFDGARLLLERAYAPFGALATGIVGTLQFFSGRISAVPTSRLEAKLSVKSDLELLDVKLPRNLYQAACLNTLYDGACGVDRAAFAVSSTAASASDPTRTNFAHSLGQADGYFSLGVITFTSGPNVGVARSVKAFSNVAGVGGARISVVSPFPFDVAAGDAFSIVPGCDKTQATCTGKFSNLARFRGMPYIPVPETVT